ncbi:MAG: photosystem II stability/assembly factor-like uncharacterized protein [Candidatus Paceibacteria bacterium]|jgi:photosystem II stability/assembly factor-like uncharacterized protein
MTHSFHVPGSCLALVLLSTLGVAQLQSSDFEGIKARSIGPAGMSGRVAAVCALESDTNVIYVGAATGGLWKSTDGGLAWKPLFDAESVASIGAVEVFQASPEVVWVGTGEGNPRNSTSVGKGLWRSTDAGQSWKHLGLDDSEKIHRIALDPGDSEVAFIGALGPTWSDGEQRGVFRTRDGGETLEQVLFVDERTGCADLVMDPTNPNKLFAAMWSHRRDPWLFTSGGEGSGLYVTRDGGDNWERLNGKNGMVDGELGRIGLAISRSNPNIVYALVEAEQNSLLRSDDGGVNWTTMNSDNDVAQRPFYYADIRVDPKDPDRVYNMASIVRVSNDAGKSWDTFVPYNLIHPDHHALWIHPDNPNFLIDGNDGGVAISTNHGADWRFCRSLPLAQFYHIAVDDDLPYHIYGGMQDNGSWRGPNDVWENGGIRNHHWEEVGFGDGFATLPLPQDSTKGYAMSQGGSVFRWDSITGERRLIRPDGPEGEELRFNWNAAIALDPFDGANALYYGSQYLHRSTDQGATWEVISPDLTSDNEDWQQQHTSGGLTLDVTAAENFCSIMTIAPSPLDSKVIWVGSDDGRLHVTLDAGKTWTRVDENVLGINADTWIPHIEASKHDANTAYAVFDDHRRGDWTTQVYKTTDYGQNWTSISNEDLDGYAHVILEDPLAEDLLFLGTEFGLWVTQNGGREWFKWTNGMPTVAVRALAFQSREDDLVIGTHGRAAYVIDDISPLRAATEESLKAPLQLFDVADAQQHRVKQTGESRFPGTEEFRGETGSYGLCINFAWNPDPEPEEEAAAEETQDSEKEEIEEEDKPELTLDVFDSKGNRMRHLKPKPSAGFNRIQWNLRRDGFRRPGSAKSWDVAPSGPEVPPGLYDLVLSYGEHEVRASFEVLADPNSEATAEGSAARWEAMRRLGALQEEVASAVDDLDATLSDIDIVTAKLKEGRNPDAENPNQDVLDQAEELKDAITEVRDAFMGARNQKGIFRNPKTIMGMIGAASWGIGSSWDAPSSTHLRRLEEAEEALQEVVPDLDRVLGEELDALRKAVDAAGVRLLPTRSSSKKTQSEAE